MKIVYIIKNIKKIEELKDNSSVIYSLDDQTSKLLSNHSLRYKEVKDSLSIKEIRAIESSVLKIVTEWYNLEEIKKYLLINEINLGFLVELELFSFLANVITNIKILEKIIQYEKPDKIIGIGNVFDLEYVAKKHNLAYNANSEQKIDNRFFMDQINIRYDFFNHPIGFTLSYEKYVILREKFEKMVNIILKIIQPRTKHKQNILLLEFNSTIFTELIKVAKNFHCKLNFLNLRRPAVWNIKSFNVLRRSNSEVMIASDFLKNEKKINTQIVEFNNNLEIMLHTY